ncbi:MAG: alpha/beta hydrolase [Methylotenera sp.]|uniref:alpha/beta fold hydrolase n=1 Tax=Methylotenera sp. TaxID=2051956 RepID=UPI00248830F9|nr:alpha/beta hydrolase [Methylotenera sp.]MDI1309622.1 alpha/beta hydrolase [Methylotenera sp.]
MNQPNDLTLSETELFVNISNDQKIRVLKTGAGEPIILMHTIRTQLDYFKEVIPELAKRYTVYALDLPGHGKSSIDKQANYDEPYMRQAVIAFIKKLDLNNVTLVGESIGAVLALTVASTMPERIIKVVSSNTYDYETRYADGVRRGSMFSNLVLANYAIPIHGAIFAALENWLFLGMVLSGGLKNRSWLPNELLSKINRAGYRKGFRYVERNVFANWRSWGKARALYSGVKAPVTLVYGDHDWSTLQERQRTASELGNAKIITIENSGHFGFVDNPAKLLEVVLNA